MLLPKGHLTKAELAVLGEKLGKWCTERRIEMDGRTRESGLAAPFRNNVNIAFN